MKYMFVCLFAFLLSSTYPLPLTSPSPPPFPYRTNLYNLAYKHNKFEAGVKVETN